MVEKAVVVERGDVAGDVPAIAHRLSRQVFASEVAVHHVRSFHEQHARRSGWQGGEAVRIDDLHGDARKRLADGSTPGGRLIVAGGSEVRTIDGDDGSTFGDAVALDGGDAELIFKCLGRTG